MEPIRLATPEEIEAIKAEADLQPGCSIWKMGEIKGVVRPCTELDPVFYGGSTRQQKALFLWGIENMMRATGLQSYYFNIPVSDEFAEYRALAEKFGAQRVSKTEEYRYKKDL